MSKILVFYGSYRSDRQGIRLARHLIDGLSERGHKQELVDARAVGLPILDRMSKEFLEEWFFRPAGMSSYSAGRLAGARASSAWHFTLSEMGMVVVPSNLADGQIDKSFAEDGSPSVESKASIEHAFNRFAADLEWWIDAAGAQRAVMKPPY